MRVIPMLLLSAVLLAPAAQAIAQTLPGTPPAFILTQGRLADLLAQCRAGNCAAAVQEILAEVRAAGLSREEFSSVVATIAATLVEETRNDSTLAAEVVSALTTASGQTTGDLSDVLSQIASLITTGNIDDIDLNAVALSLETDEVEAEEEPTGGDNGSAA